MGRRSSGAAILAPCLIAVLAAAPDAAADGRSGQAARLFEKGRVLAQHGKLVDACKAFAQSLELEVAPGTQLNLGDCAERDGRLLDAHSLFAAAEAEYTRTHKDASAAFAKKRRLAVEARLTHEPDEREEPDDSAPDSPPSEPAHPAPTTEPLPTATPTRVRATPGATDDTPSYPRQRSRVRIALGLGIGAGVFGIASGVLAFTAKRDYDDAVAHCVPLLGGALACDSASATAIDQARTRADLATGFAIAAGVSVVAAAIVYVTAPRERPPTVTVVPTASLTQLGLALSGHF